MKKIIYILLGMLFTNIFVLSEQFDFTPLRINFIGVEAQNDVVIAYGDIGSFLISYDNGEIWKQSKIFKNSNIQKVFWNNSIIAFSNTGEIAKSSDNFQTWEPLQELKENILGVIEYSDGYLIRTPEKLITLNKDFQKSNETMLISPPLTDKMKFQYRKSIAFYQDNFIVAIDSARFIRYDLNLHTIDTISFYDIFGTSIISKYEIDIMNDSLFVALGNSIHKTYDFKTSEIVYQAKYEGFYKFINDKIYHAVFSLDLNMGSYVGPFRLFEVINKDSINQVAGTYRIRETINSFLPRDFIINKNKVIAVGDSKLIATITLNDTVTHINSFLYASSVPDQLDDSTFLVYPELIYGNYLSQIYKTTDNGTTFKPFYKFEHSASNRYNRIIYKYFNRNNNLLYLFARNSTNDGRQAVMILDKEGNEVQLIENNPNIFNAVNQDYANFQIRGNNFIFANNSFYQKSYTSISTINDNFERVSYFIDSNYVIRYFHSKDTNTFLINCLNSFDNTFEIRFTNDKNNNWEILKKYEVGIKLLQYKELYLNGGLFAAFVYFNQNDSTILIDVINTENKEITTISNSKINPAFDENSIAFDSDGEKIYFSKEDTLFQISDMKNKSSWKYYILPDKGRVIKNMKKINDSAFVVQYMDNNSNRSLFKMTIKGEPTSIEYSETEDLNYLYAYPPYPLPAANQVKTLIYWDMSIDIDNDEICVYDIYGTKIAGKEKITIEKLTGYSGNIVWDCSGSPTGIYLINIKHGTENRTIKVIVTK